MSGSTKVWLRDGVTGIFAGEERGSASVPLASGGDGEVLGVVCRSDPRTVIRC